MARPDTRYVCGSCGTWHAKWSGRCDACGEWNTLAEEAAPKPVPKGLRAAGRTLELVGLRGTTASVQACRQHGRTRAEQGTATRETR